MINKSKWQLKKLGEVCKITYGKGLSTKELKESGFPVFGANGIIGFNDKYLYKESQVLISCRGAYSGKINFSPPLCYVTNNSLILEILNEEEINKKFLFHVLHTVNKTKLVTGTAQPQVTINNAVELTFTIPNLETQQAIVSKIEELFSELDKGIEDLKTAQQQLKTYRQSVLKWAFEGKLTNENVKDGELPKGWTLSTIEKVANKITDGEHFRPPTQSDGIAFLSAKDVRDNGVSFDAPLYISEETAKKALQRCNPQLGDILIVSRGATVGRMCIVNTSRQFCLLGSVILIKVNENINNLFLNYVLKSPIANQKMITVSGATAQQAIYLRDIKKIEIPLPPLAEQHQIIQEIESRLSVADKMEESIAHSLLQAESLRQSILKKAFSGELV